MAIQTPGRALDAAFATLATKADLAAVDAKVQQLDDKVQKLDDKVTRMEGLTLGLIDAFNANTKTMEAALNNADIKVKLRQAGKSAEAPRARKSEPA